MLMRLCLLTSFYFCVVRAVLSGNELKRRESGFNLYGSPPNPAPSSQQLPHREYGVPQQIPFREYGPPALKYGFSKLNHFGGAYGPTMNGLYEQIKAHFDLPKPFYGPPHVQYRPTTEYGMPQLQYGPPAPQYPPPLKIQHRPAPQYAEPAHKLNLFIPSVSSQLFPIPHPAQVIKPTRHPATSYGPPASGPLNLPAKPTYETPPNYGPPPLPINLPGPQPTDFKRAPETTIILSSAGVQRFPSNQVGRPSKHVQIQIDASGHTHSVSGSQTPFHTACDGWKPIPAPIGSYVEKNHIETQGGYSLVEQGRGTITQNNVGTTVNSPSDEQIVAVALQGEPRITVTGPSRDGHLNTIDSEALQISVSATDDTYSKPPTDSYQPGSVHDHQYNTVGSNAGRGVPLPQTFGPKNSASLQQPLSKLTSSYVQSQAQTHSHHNSNIQYGSYSDNPQFGPGHPKSPVEFRPPVPTGLIESIGATVQHLDEFGIKPPQQSPIYIPPAAHEIALSGVAAASPPIYGVPLHQQVPPQIIIQQQLPQSHQGPTFANTPLGVQSLPRLHYIPPSQQQPVPKQYFSDRPSANIHLSSQQSISNNAITQNMPLFFYSQALPLMQQIDQFNHQRTESGGQNHKHHHHKQIVLHDCGQGPNLVSSSGYQVHQQQKIGISPASPDTYNAIAQSVPIAERHTQFFGGPANSYGTPPFGNEVDIDHFGYASQKSAVATLPDGTNLQQLPGLDGLNVISAKKSQSIKFGPPNGQLLQNFQVQSENSLNDPGNSQSSDAYIDDSIANHEEILSQGLLQSILTAIEEPQSSSFGPQNHSVQSRSDDQYQEIENQQIIENEVQEANQHHDTSKSVKARVMPDTDNKIKKDDDIVPIVAAAVEENSKH